MTRLSYLIVSSLIFAGEIRAGSAECLVTPGNVYGAVGGSAEIAWNYDLGGNDLALISWEHLDASGLRSLILSVDPDGAVIHGKDFPHATFAAPATLTLNPMRATDEGDVICSIFTTNGDRMSDSVPVIIVPPDDQKEFETTIKIADIEIECGIRISIDSDETIMIEVPVESNSGAPMEVNTFQKCGGGLDYNIGTEITKGSGICTFETFAACDGFKEGLVTIKATVKHPAFVDAKEDTCSYILAGGSHDEMP
ncbi:hypothetical protein CAPTEDRAFT_204561 [Capitella teleta]|uniref:Ig-like domain-containing protein n=1 Tax=Capitella teleta TaxID=283909 RepID=R7U4B6_CAPTE|nr:hypothetical protein CAPTEDRAFT_204561 [Capitella teleta]|eukprot:ELT98015.1 hypothetical protein CAPTEDRAFT_204561 [Capitella teleta]